MNRLDSALARLNAALKALETGVAERSALSDQSAIEEQTELKAERDRLAARVASLEEDSRYLAGLTDEVENRLDGAITEIRDALSRN